jgi:hypothetical protein
MRGELRCLYLSTAVFKINRWLVRLKSTPRFSEKLILSIVFRALDRCWKSGELKFSIGS